MKEFKFSYKNEFKFPYKKEFKFPYKKEFKFSYGFTSQYQEEEYQETPSEKLHREEEERKAYWNDYWNNKAQPCIID